MAVSQRIKDMAVLVNDYAPNAMDTYQVLALLSALDDFVQKEVDLATHRAAQTFINDADRLRSIIENSDVILSFLYTDRKILAIKALRQQSGAGLREAKDAVLAFDLLNSSRYQSMPGSYASDSFSKWYDGDNIVTDTNRPPPPF